MLPKGTVSYDLPETENKPVPTDGAGTSGPLRGEINGGGKSTAPACGTSAAAAIVSRSVECGDVIGLRRLKSAALLLRLRVTQVVCGLVAMVLGAVACIEERGHFQVGTGVVAGALTVVAAVASIRTAFGDVADRTRWIHGMTPSSTAALAAAECRTAALLSTLWAAAVIANLVTLAFAVKVLVTGTGIGHNAPGTSEYGDVASDVTRSDSANLAIIGALEVVLGLVTLAILVTTLRLASRYKHLGLDKK